MAVDPNSLSVGKCYVTASGQVRRVTDITMTGRVDYEARGSRKVDKWHRGATQSNLPSLARFAGDVDREVKCSYHPDYLG